MTSYTLADIQAIKSEIDAKKYAPGGVLGPKWTVHVGSNEGFVPLGHIAEAEWEKLTDDAAFTRTTPPKCHCGRDWHTAPLRKRVANMLRGHYFDPEYRAAEDDSPIVCVGSETYGPNRPGEHRRDVIVTYGGNDLGVKQGAPWVTAYNAMWNIIGGNTAGLPADPFNIDSWWGDYPKEPTEPCPEIPELDIQLGPEYWPVEPVKAKFSERHFAGKAVAAVPVNEWREPVLLPERLALDVSALAEEFNKKHNPPKYPTKGLNT